MTCSVTKQGIRIDGKKTQIISGALHYFRVLPPLWEDRLKKLKELGCNAVDTYTPWNVHEKEEGMFDFSDGADLGRFLDTAAGLGLYAVVRPGPYICSEWEFGGLPWWLLARGDISLRCSAPRFLEKTRRFMSEVCRVVAPRQISRGGNVILVQLENEYGSYGDDKTYLLALREMLTDGGIEVPLFTSDNHKEILFENGGLDDVWKTVNYRSDSAYAVDALKAHQPCLPAGVAELWNGRAMQWGEPYAPREVPPIARSLEDALRLADYVSLYMFHGGTNFGFMNGAVCGGDGRFLPQLTSYDVDAPLNEYGERTEKFYAEQRVIYRHLGLKTPPRGEAARLRAFGEAAFEGFAGLFGQISALAERKRFASVPSMEEAGQGYGSIVYATRALCSGRPLTLVLPKIGDAAEVYVNGAHIASLYRSDGPQSVEFEPEKGTFELKILVSNLGRLNFGYRMADKKGLVGDVTLVDGSCAGFKRIVHEWTVDTVRFDRLPTAYGAVENQPGFYKYAFTAQEPADTFVQTEGFTRGCVFLNGFNLGRHWRVGPQKTLYAPAPLVRSGRNELIVYDDGLPQAVRRVTLTDRHVLTDLTL